MRIRLHRRFLGEESHKDIRGIIEFLETTSVCACGEGVESDRAEGGGLGRCTNTRL